MDNNKAWITLITLGPPDHLEIRIRLSEGGPKGPAMSGVVTIGFKKPGRNETEVIRVADTDGSELVAKVDKDKSNGFYSIKNMDLQWAKDRGYHTIVLQHKYEPPVYYNLFPEFSQQPAQPTPPQPQPAPAAPIVTPAAPTPASPSPTQNPPLPPSNSPEKEKTTAPPHVVAENLPPTSLTIQQGGRSKGDKVTFVSTREGKGRKGKVVFGVKGFFNSITNSATGQTSKDVPVIWETDNKGILTVQIDTDEFRITVKGTLENDPEQSTSCELFAV